MASKVNLKKADAQSINIQSYIRVRPLAAKEKKAHVLEFGKKEVTIKSAAESSKVHKTLHYDRVFDEESKQIVVYNTVVKPMIKEVLQGYNCTVFAYGQTGTGKTYTMTGDQDSQASWEENVHAGIVPRAMQDLFSELALQAGEYQVSVSYMELYNEKLRSLLQDSDDTDIKLIDDLEGGVLVKGLTPTPVKGKEEAFRLLQQGAEKRQVAATQMNMNSSRSHTIFTINVNIKESVVAGKDDVLRCGKLHLVDLAGSENVSKSGASETIHKTATGVNKRLAEASNINKSLLTLGRVITCLTENNPHIPYRESKLTRFLQDSLGGRTKTCIIGTISPAQSNLDETESTLNYAYKARSIKNKPVKNQTISKKDFMQVASEEIMKLKKDLEAVRQGEGFYISKESHDEMITRMKELDDQVKDWHEKYSRINELYEQTKEMFSSLSSDHEDKCAEYDELENLFRLESQRCQEKLTEFAKEVYVREYFIREYEKTEDNLTDQAKTCKSVLENLLEQSYQLHDKIDRKRSNESENIKTLSSYKENVSKKVADFQNTLDAFLNEEKMLVQEISKYAGTLYDIMREEKGKVIESVSSFEQQMAVITQSANDTLVTMRSEFSTDVEECKALGEKMIKQSTSLYRDFIESHILPSMKDNQDWLTLLTRAAEERRNHLNKYEARQAELISQITENHQALTETIKITMNEIDIIKQQNSKVSTSAGAIHNSASNVSQQILKAMQYLKTVQEEINLINKEGSLVVESASAASERAEALGETVKSAMEQYGSNQSQLIDAVDKISQERSECHNALTSQIGEDVSDLLAKGDSQLTFMKGSVDDHVCQMEALNEREKEINLKLEGSASKLTDYLSHTSQAQDHEVKQFVGELKSKLNDLTESHEKILRNQGNLTHQKLKQLNENKLTQVIQNLEEDLKTIGYAEYVPLGTTPKRICKDSLEYPRKFDSTAPRLELVKKLREKYPETENVPNDNLNLKKHLPAGPFFNGEIHVSTESSPSSVKSARTTTGNSVSSVNFDAECTPQARASALRRKSTSMPDLKNLLDDVFVAPSPVENKENIRIRSAKRYGKTKIPDVVKTKKKTVLSAVQNMNNSTQ